MNTTVVYSVSQITNRLNYCLEKQFNQIFVKGEISSFRLYDSGHAYFTLKDQSSIINCVYFNYVNLKEDLLLKENIEVVVFGDINIYKSRGSIQLIVSNVHIGKEGDLWHKYLRLKNRLEKEGLFDKIHKKELPYIQRKITIISSKEGAVIHDILNIIYRRAPYIDINIKHSLVQGASACDNLVEAIQETNKETIVDLIIIARGGGSLEDLMAFNNEQVVREIFKSKIPVITGIGHETDFTLSDFVSDKRAATPSEAAEICAPDLESLYKKIDLFENNILSILNSRVEEKFNLLNTYYLRILSKNPKLNVEFYNENLILNYKILKNTLIDKLSNYKNTLRKYKNRIQRYDINHIKDRGFFIVKKQNEILKSIKKINIGDEVDIELKDGQIKARINKIYAKKNKN